MLESTFIGGIAFGLASALHCGAMCGGIACGALLLLGATTARERILHLALMQLGRVATYATIGMVGAAIGSGLVTRHVAMNYAIMQWAAAVALLWTGLVTAGVMPRLAVVDRGMLQVASFADDVMRPLRGRPYAGPIALGVAWGLNACPMVYGAAFFASLSGSVAKGALFMTGFGLGTVPAVVLAAYGLTSLRRVASQPLARYAAGATIALVGIASVYVPWTMLPAFCLSR